MSQHPLAEAIERFEYLDWEFHLAFENLILEIKVHCLDSRNPDQSLVVTHRYDVPHASAVVWKDHNYGIAYLRQCVQKTVLHEMDEWIRVDGQIAFDPHRDEHPAHP